MKNFLFISFLMLTSFIYSQGYSKTPEDLGLSAKEYKKIKKKLKINVINNGFDFDTYEKIYVGEDGGRNTYVSLWKDVIFEMNLKEGTLDNADYIFVIGQGGIDLKVLDYNDENKLLARVTSSKKQYAIYSNSRQVKFKNRIKVFLNELFKTVN